MRKSWKFKIIHYSIFSILFNLLIFISYKTEISSFYDYFGFAFGYININNINNISSIIIWLLPRIVLLIYLGDFIEKNLLKNYSIIFTRTNKKTIFIIKTIKDIFFHIVYFYIVNIAIILIISKLFNITIFNNGYKIISIIVKFILFDTIFILFVNIISVANNARIGAYIGLICQIAMIYITSTLVVNNVIYVKYIPLSNVLFKLQDSNIIINDNCLFIYFIVIILMEIFVCIETFRWKEGI